MGKAQAGHPLRVLLVEDSPDDAELVMRELRRGGFAPNYERVDTAEAMRAALREGGWEAIIADFVMPRFSAGDALQVYKQSGLDIPFIVISGTVTDEVAVELVRTGAHDYVMKDKLVRLPPALHRELRDAATRRERREADEALRRAYNELEVRVRERTADLAAANAALQGEIARREQQRVQLSARVDELAALFDVSRTVLGVTGVQGIAHSVCELVVERFGLRMAWLGAVQNHEGEAGAGRLVPMTAVGYGRDYVDRKAVDLGDETRARTPVMRALRTLEPVNVSDIATEPTMGDAFRQAALERGYRSFLAVPMGVDDHADSVLVAYAGVEEAFDDSRVQTLQSVANLARLAMLKAELHEQVERHAETLE